MAVNKTDIEWVYGSDGAQGYTWNPVVGCSPASAGCDNCYAARIANRFKGTKAFPDGFKVTLRPERLDEPRKLKKPSRIFVCSMSDIFHPDVPDEFIERIFKVMRECPQHTFFVLTKRPERMAGTAWAVCSEHHAPNDPYVSNWYAPNVWVGVSAENQEMADKRIPQLMGLPVAHRFVSVEPMIGPVDLELYLPIVLNRDWLGIGTLVQKRVGHVDWVICGAESGPGKRGCRTDWVEDLWEQCRSTHTPFFFKKWNDNRDNPGGFCRRQRPEKQ